MAVERRARTTWTGTIVGGSGSISAGSGAFTNQPISLDTRISDPNGHTSPEELIAAAHGACFAMSVSSVLTGRGISPDAIVVDALCVEGPVDDGFAITGIELAVSVRAAGLDERQLHDVIDEAERGCPVSKAFAGNVPVKIRPSLS